MSEVALNQVSQEELMRLTGMANETGGGGSKNKLPRLRMWHTPLMGVVEVDGKKKKMEVVEAGQYRLEQEDGTFAYAPEANIRFVMQSFMYKRYISDPANSRYVKTLMSDNLNSDLKDTDGGFNCGKPAGFIEDWNSVPDKMKDLIKSIKRVRVLFGEIDMVGAVNEKGEPIEVATSPFIWEVDNREAFKTFGDKFKEIIKRNRSFIQFSINVTGIEREMNNGQSYFVPKVDVDFSSDLAITDHVLDMHRNSSEWITQYNDYINSEFTAKAVETLNTADESLVNEFIDVE
jgi:hypothetical protein|tara:strand:- start:231 stop:1100 length:870 start_codon:yes stop_codon:yes gene_type:complete